MLYPKMNMMEQNAGKSDPHRTSGRPESGSGATAVIPKTIHRLASHVISFIHSCIGWWT